MTMIPRKSNRQTQEQPSKEERLEFHARQEAEGSARQMASEQSRQLAEEVIRNPRFLNEYTDPDADSRLHDWVEDELGPEFSRAHVFGYRKRAYERQVKWLSLNAAERFLAERSPGRTLKKHPDVLRVMQGAGYNPETGETNRERFRPPIHQDQRRIARGGFEVAANRKSLSIEGKGTDATTTATAEHRTVHNRDEEEKSSARRAASKLFR